MPLCALPSGSQVGLLELFSFKAASYNSLHGLQKETGISRGLFFHPTLSEMNYPLEALLSFSLLTVHGACDDQTSHA